MRYFLGTINYELHYTGYPSASEGYSDSNWISDADENQGHNWIYIHAWQCCCLIEILQTYHIDEVSHRSRTHSVIHSNY